MMARWIAPYCCDSRALVRLAGLAVPLLIWEVASRAGLLHSVFTPPFTQAALKVLTLPVESPADFVVTTAEILVALFATGLCGMTLGVILARSERIDALLGGLIWFLYAAPVVVFTTLFIVIFGVGPDGAGMSRHSERHCLRHRQHARRRASGQSASS